MLVLTRSVAPLKHSAHLATSPSAALALVSSVPTLPSRSSLPRSSASTSRSLLVDARYDPAGGLPKSNDARLDRVAYEASDRVEARESRMLGREVVSGGEADEEVEEESVARPDGANDWIGGSRGGPAAGAAVASVLIGARSALSASLCPPFLPPRLAPGASPKTDRRGGKVCRGGKDRPDGRYAIVSIAASRMSAELLRAGCTGTVTAVDDVAAVDAGEYGVGIVGDRGPPEMRRRSNDDGGSGEKTAR